MNRRVIIIFIVLATFSGAVFAEPTDKIFTVGIVPQSEARELHKVWRPILDLLEKETGLKFKIRGSSSIPKFEQELVQGKFDFAYMNPYHLIIANGYAGYIPLIRDHGHKLSGILVVKKDSGITSPAQLNGKTLAFPAPNALGASLQMRQELHDIIGIKFKSNFVKTHDSVYLNVLLNEADAGGGVQKTLDLQKKEYKDMLQVIYETQKVAPHPLAALPDVPAEIRNRVLDALLKIGQSKEGKELLLEIPVYEIGPASMQDYLPIKDMGLERFYVAPPK